ncbi:hypothetical protein [Phenylobacterium sp.]|uniref:hypothetical protein n=1 Tax=Phenylobacterium sp. TaxID=1871053 RepID=UPI002D7E7174|nr:hypothetical protein [Phenylobacterium sp.]
MGRRLDGSSPHVELVEAPSPEAVAAIARKWLREHRSCHAVEILHKGSLVAELNMRELRQEE